MLFNSVTFLFAFLPTTWGAWYLAQRRWGGGAARSVLLGSSLVFYGAWNAGRDLPLLLASLAGNFGVGARLVRRPSRRLLAVAVVGNLALLLYWKYANFGLGAWQQLTGRHVEPLDLALPLGLSFWTFQQLAYLVDCHQGKLAGDYSWGRYALFVTFFPHLLAGPLVHHGEMVRQFDRFGPEYRVQAEQVGRGLLLLVAGLVRKVLIADTLARWVDPAFAHAATLGFYDAWTATLAYSLQLYFDFSGYSEMAMGVALFFGVTLPENFRSPYKARDVQDFWRRWHITLGRFLRDYLYVPLGGGRHGVARAMTAGLATMLLGGLWHGAGWTFVAWGGLHGALLCVFLAWKRVGRPLPPALGRGLTFFVMLLGWVTFRAATWADAAEVYGALFGAHGLTAPPVWADAFPALGRVVEAHHSTVYSGGELIALVALLGVLMSTPSAEEWSRVHRPSRRSALAGWLHEHRVAAYWFVHPHHRLATVGYTPAALREFERRVSQVVGSAVSFLTRPEWSANDGFWYEVNHYRPMLTRMVLEETFSGH